jgi:2-octaprenyl-6-methoxyphenol hydroxylase
MDFAATAWERRDMASATAILTNPDVTILGGGPIGYLAALCIADRLSDTKRIRLITGRRVPPADGRGAALVGRSMAILDQIGLGAAFREEGAPLAAIRIIDVTGRLVRAPTTTFRASDAGEPHFGVSLTTARIVDLMAEKAQAGGRIDILPVDIKDVSREEQGFRLTDDQGRAHHAPFLVAADGQRSLAREAADIPVRRWSYPQTALTFAVTHTLDHEEISTEFHTGEGPFTLVPAGDRLSTVVWMTRTEEAERLMALDETAFARTAEKTCRSILGKLTLASPRGAYPMGGLLAERFTAPGIALVGETGHAFPPIGAQGMNLGFRDADTLADALKNAFADGKTADPSDALARWDRDRRRDAGLRTAGVDAFNRLLLTDLLPVTMARGLGLAALKNIPPLRRAVMRMGLGQ